MHELTAATAAETGLDEHLVREALEATRLLVVVVGSDGVVIAANRRVALATGLSERDCQRPIWELAALPAERASLRTAFAPLRPELLPASLFFHLATTIGAARVVDWDVRLVGGDEAPVAAVLAGIDVSERLAADEHLHENEALQRLVLDRMPAIVWTTDTELRFTYSGGGALIPSLGLRPGRRR